VPQALDHLLALLDRARVAVLSTLGVWRLALDTR
jgi:hypothetical protein